jgi:hypothetical protein
VEEVLDYLLFLVVWCSLPMQMLKGMSETWEIPCPHSAVFSLPWWDLVWTWAQELKCPK